MSKRRDAKALLKREGLRDAFDSLLPLPGLWAGLRLGVLQRILCLSCDDEIIAYLLKVRKVWGTFLLEDAESMAALDSESVQHLELRAPGMTATDDHHISEKISNGQLLPRIEKDTTRKAIAKTILSYKGIVPSIKTLFEDTKYLEVCAVGMKLLLSSGPHSSLRRFFEAAFSISEVAVLETGQEKYEIVGIPPAKRFDHAYQQLWLFNMRNFPDLAGVNPRQDKKEKRNTRSRNSMISFRLHQLASKLGFQTANISRVLQEDPLRKCTQEFLSRLWPGDLSEATAGLEA
ncbi:hypothetical protein ABW20_dc0101238 [Dactylellina cionopaga]|nr:hypothetical protein ABW20_dc0101238 [Dactylellina cionopaga]